ncbi:unnamed protein product [Mytilus edulis]|uniref:Uncharacterized protein n=1 Tax=Mytilus edulis TaxID=6550 RepID=A0A8S3RUP7_MYTED|nr:unnamed protein product [Mytilus edulis]
MEKESKRPPCFKISVPGDDSKKKDVLDKLQHVRSIIVKEMNHPVNNAYILEKVLDEFISTHSVDNSGTKMENMNLNTYIQGANIGHINKSKQSYMFDKYKRFVDEEYNDSIETALMEEVGMYEDLTSIDIMTDARHGWRKNAKDSSVVAIGEKMHKVLKCEHITKADDFVSQRHEKLGTQRIYQNMSINKLVRESGVVNQNDSWHGIKAVKKCNEKVSSGPKYLQGKTWSEQLEDKVESVATHFHWAIRNCEQNPKELKDLLINVVEHYKNNHTKCHPDSRCKRDVNYEPKRSTINKPIAEKLLLSVIHKSVIFKSPDHFVLARDTSYVESFNNTMNMFQDKRIVFSDANYNARACLAVCHWNENVDRGFTSIWNPERRNAPRSMKGKKNYKPPSYSYRNNIWKRQIDSIYL